MTKDTTRHVMIPLGDVDPALAAWVDELGAWVDALGEGLPDAEAATQEWVSFVVFTAGEWLWVRCGGAPSWAALDLEALGDDYARAAGLDHAEWAIVRAVLARFVMLLAHRDEIGPATTARLLGQLR